MGWGSIGAEPARHWDRRDLWDLWDRRDLWDHRDLWDRRDLWDLWDRRDRRDLRVLGISGSRDLPSGIGIGCAVKNASSAAHASRSSFVTATASGAVCRGRNPRSGDLRRTS